MADSFAPIILRNLCSPEFDFDSLTWEPFREGVRIHRLYGRQSAGPSAALLRYEAGAGIPRHIHNHYEHILVLRASQRDEHGDNTAGTLVINPPGSSHTVFNDKGSVVLAIWQGPITFVAPEPIGSAAR